MIIVYDFFPAVIAQQNNGKLHDDWLIGILGYLEQPFLAFID